MKLWREPTDAEIFADDVVWDETGFVPVEPDYGKAEAMFQVVASTAIGLGLTPAVRAVVDAALGIGETP